MTYVLGIHDGHNASACLIRDGEILSCVSEERFTRVKNHIGWPVRSIQYVLEHAKITAQDLDLVVLGSYLINQPGHESLGKESKTSALSFYRGIPYPLKKRIYSMPDWFLDSMENFLLPRAFKANSEARKKDLAKLLQVDGSKIILAEHHTCHAYTSIYGSGFNEDSLIFTMDGEGDGICASVNILRDGNLERIASTKTRHSLGLLYMEITRLLGMKANEHEYKVMGLAPYAPEDGLKKTYDVLSSMIKFDENNLSFKSKVYSRVYLPHLQEKLALQRFDWIAGGIQKLTEDLTMNFVGKGIEKTGINNVALAGGVFMNVKANLRILEMPSVNKFFVFPSCGDESIAIGAAYFGYEKICKDAGRKCDAKPIGPLCLGPEFSNVEVEKLIDSKNLRQNYKVSFFDDIESETGKMLANGEIVARMSGRMEWGARALGNRSIMSKASSFDAIKTINFMIKMRDFWMPFAPSILDYRADDYVQNPKNVQAPYMILAFNSKERASKDLQAAMHPYDLTVRPQIVTEEFNPSYYKILKVFEEATGMGGFLNTSFNLHGEPIVCSPEDAIHTLEDSGLKNLIMGNYLVQKI